jgi:hypothetical protein
MFRGEPVRREKLVKGDGTGFLSALLPAGRRRAIAISIDAQGGTTAGGFILPNDRVDVIWTWRDLEKSKTARMDIYTSETILTNVRVLAIGQNVQDKNGEKVVAGGTATLELEPLAGQYHHFGAADRTIVACPAQHRRCEPDRASQVFRRGRHNRHTLFCQRRNHDRHALSAPERRLDEIETGGLTAPVP